MNVYPSILPASAVEQLVKAALKPSEINTKNLVAASYQLLGYVLGQSVGEPTALIGLASQEVQLQSLEVLYKQLDLPLVAGAITKDDVATIIAKHIVMLTVELLKKPGSQPVV